MLRALSRELVSPPPIWLMRQAGRYLPEYREIRRKAPDFLALCYSPDLAAEITLQPIRRFGLDAAILFSDILVVPDALGMKVTFREGEGPLLERLETARELTRLRVPVAVERLAPVYETVRRVKRELPENVALIGFAGAPWTVATYMIEGSGDREFVRAKTWAYGDAAAFAALIDILVETSIAHLAAQAEAGVDAVQVFDSWCGVLPDDDFDRWCIEPMQRIVAGVRAKAPGLPIIGFPRGAGLNLGRYVAATGVDAVSLDTTVPLAHAAELQRSVVVQGNLDPIALLAGGDVLGAHTRRIVKALGQGPFIFNLGHGVLPRTPPKHVGELVALVRAGR
ncbi:MAG: uroporphyrinogen decarboxylase [Alphaproteobacteria bacterium]|nr:uroporphyrinogen decarboxylase [Alphaproteobacteria bacterium]